MTVTTALLSFALVAGLMTLVPGVDTALILRSAVTRSRREALLAALGICTGVLLWGVVAAAGASAVLAASQLAYRVLTFAGAGYLVFLGAQMIYRSFTRRQPGTVDVGVPGRTHRAFGVGLLTNLLNPKIGVFYLAAIPQFTPPQSHALLMGLALATVHVVLSLVWAGVLILGATLASRWLRTGKAVGIMDRITGTILIGFGLRVAFSRP